MTSCKLCTGLSADILRDPWNEPLIESDHFVVIPSLGALVAGWLLIVPKAHFISMGAIPVSWRAEADELQIKTQKLLKDQYAQPILVFEHGPSAEKHGTGCGVDHAHLHLLPLDCDILRLVEPFVSENQEWLICDWEERSEAYRTGQDYLYFKSEGCPARIALNRDFGSQVFRKAISAHLGIPEEFSWREYPQLAIVDSTIRALENVDFKIRQRGTEHAA
jgi:ATP adenylyltransferase